MENDSISLHDQVNVVVETANALVKDMRNMEFQISQQSLQGVREKISHVVADLKELKEAVPRYCEMAHAHVLTEKSAGVHFEGNIKEDINLFGLYAKTELQQSMDDLNKQSARLQYSGSDLKNSSGDGAAFHQ